MMNIVLNIVFFLLGAVLSFAIARYFYNKGNKETPQWFNVSSIKSILTKNPNDIDWTAEQIVELYQSKIYTNDHQPLPYKYCPECGSSDLKGGTFNDDVHDEVYHSLKCKKCGWSDWTQ